MIPDSIKPENTDAYISLFPAETRAVLEKLRAIIKEAAPQATEVISYQMPTFKLEGNLVHYAAYKNHIGFYPGASGVKAFEKELSAYQLSKGTVRFPIDLSLPAALIGEIVKFRVKQNSEKAAAKKSSRLTAKRTDKKEIAS